MRRCLVGVMVWVAVVGCGAKEAPRPEMLESCKQRMETAKARCINNGLEVDFGPKAKEHNAAICSLTKATPEENKTGDKATDEAASNRCDFEKMSILERSKKIRLNSKE